MQKDMHSAEISGNSLVGKKEGPHVRLSEMEYKRTGIIKKIAGESRDLGPIGIRTGKKVKMVTKQPVKGPVVIVCGEVEVAIGMDTASGIIVELTEEESGCQ